MNQKFFPGLAVVFATVTTLQFHAQTGPVAATPSSPGAYTAKGLLEQAQAQTNDDLGAKRKVQSEEQNEFER
jgi:hypothetical protein